MIILQFIFGVKDSLRIGSSVQRYLYPGRKLTTLDLLKKLFWCQEVCSDPLESQLITEKALESFKQAFKFTLYSITLLLVQNFIEDFLGQFILSQIIYWPIIAFMYSSFAASMWMRTQEITQQAIQMELQHYQSQQFIAYQIDDSSPIQLMDEMMTRILFSILFQVQSNLLCTIISKVLPFPLNLLRIIIYALFISIQNISAKIPYKLHLGYYYQQNQWYLIGLNFLLSCYLHVSSFPIFTGILWLLLPWYLLNSIPREPPRFVVEGNQPLSFSEYLTVCRKAVFQKDDGRIGRVVVTRESYLMHIQQVSQDEEYEKKCKKHLSYISLPTLLVPSVQLALSKGLSRLRGHQQE